MVLDQVVVAPRLLQLAQAVAEDEVVLVAAAVEVENLRRGVPAGEVRAIDPAGEMWSVVTLSPSMTSTRAPSMSAIGSGSALSPEKKGGSAT